MSWRASGLRAWVWQRVTAVYLGLFTLGALGFWAFGSVCGYQQWRAWIAQPWAALLVGLFFLALLAHAWVGIRDVVLDYLSLPALRFTALALIALWLLAMGLWVLLILARIF